MPLMLDIFVGNCLCTPRILLPVPLVSPPFVCTLSIRLEATLELVIRNTLGFNVFNLNSSVRSHPLNVRRLPVGFVGLPVRQLIFLTSPSRFPCRSAANSRLRRRLDNSIGHHLVPFSAQPGIRALRPPSSTPRAPVLPFQHHLRTRRTQPLTTPSPDAHVSPLYHRRRASRHRRGFVSCSDSRLQLTSASVVVLPVTYPGSQCSRRPGQ